MHRILPITFILLLCLSCDEKKEQIASTKEAVVETWEFQSELFKIKLPSVWKKEDPAGLNSFAKFAASKNNNHFILVIPQKLPEIPGIETPDAFALKRASINIMRSVDKEFKIEVEGPAIIGGIVAQSVVASGVVEGEKLQYVTSYLTSGNTGIQIVAWGPYEEGKKLVQETDKILANFKMLDIDKVAPKIDEKTDNQTSGNEPTLEKNKEN